MSSHNDGVDDAQIAQSFRRATTGLDFGFALGVARELGIEPGAGVTIAHFDEGWQLDHPVLNWMNENVAKIDFLGVEPIDRGRSEHGTAVLGLHLGRFSGSPMGAALLPGARYLLIQSRDTESQASVVALKRGIELLKQSLPAVLLIARDWSSRAPHLPYELKPGIAALLADASQAGIVVIEAAGNAGIDLDLLVVRNSATVRDQVTLRDDPWISADDDIEPAFLVETGALIVGACTAIPPFRRWTAGFRTNPQPRSNFGSRIDCWAPGEKLLTAGSTPHLNSDFGGSSGAAALIAASVALVQSIALARETNGAALPVAMIRTLFRISTLENEIFSEESTIGSVPNLQKILDYR